MNTFTKTEVFLSVFVQIRSSVNGALAILKKRLNRTSFSYIFISDVRSIGVRASISIVQIRKDLLMLR